MGGFVQLGSLMGTS